MIECVARLVWRIICWIELSVFTLILYLLSCLPRSLIKGFYFPLFRIWCRSFVRALGVNLRVHRKDRRDTNIFKGRGMIGHQDVMLR